MLQLKNIYKTYSSKNGVTHRALENVSLKFAEKGLVFILGKSGSGKSTLLNLIGGIDNYDRGEIIFNNKNFTDFKESDYDYYRNSCVGFVFQDFNLLENLTVFENVSLALELQSKKDDEKIMDLLEKMGVAHLKNRMINELSGGQRQRVSIARALVKNPSIILADEPTGALDSETSDEIIKILSELSKDRLVIIVTHNKELAYDYGDRIIEIRDGFVLKDLLRNTKADESKNESTLVSSNLVIVPKNCEISDENINDLNVTISEKRQDYYLLIEDDKHRAMSLYPNVSEVIDTDNIDKTFIPYYHEKKDYSKQEKAFKSNLPLKKGIKFAFSNLKRKKLKLVFTILLAILSVIFTGAAANFTQYSLSNAVGMSIEKDNGSYLEVSSSFSIYNNSYTLQQNDMNYLNSLEREIAYSYDIPLTYYYDSTEVDPLLSRDNLFYDKTFRGLLITDDISNYGYKSKDFKVIYEKENIIEEDYKTGVYISSIVAETIVKYSAYDNRNVHTYNSIKDLVGDSIRLSSGSYTVLGIYDWDKNESLYNYFKSLHDTNPDGLLLREYNNIAQSTLLRLVVRPEFLENYKDTRRYLSLKTHSSNIIDMDVSADSVRPLSNIDFSISKNDVYFYSKEVNESNFNEKIKTLKPNQIFIGKKFFRSLVNEDFKASEISHMRELIERFNSQKHTMTIKSKNASSNEAFQSIKDVEIMGVVIVCSGDSSLNTAYVGTTLFDEMVDDYYTPKTALVKMNKSDDYSSFVQTLYDNGFTINNEFVSYFLEFASIIEQYSLIINLVAIVWFAIVALLLYSFMSSSIKDNARQIGILKALGANIKDTYKIYAVEAVVIGLFAIVFGILGYYFGGLLVNEIITSLFYTFYFAIFTFEPLTFVIMILSTVLVLIVSLIIPMSKISKIKPIDVMNS